MFKTTPQVVMNNGRRQGTSMGKMPSSPAKGDQQREGTSKGGFMRKTPMLGISALGGASRMGSRMSCASSMN